jgi:hypothetical protein
LKELFNISLESIVAFVGYVVVVVVVVVGGGFVDVVASDLSNPNHQNRPKRPKQNPIHFLDYSETEKNYFVSY